MESVRCNLKQEVAVLTRVVKPTVRFVARHIAGANRSIRKSDSDRLIGPNILTFDLVKRKSDSRIDPSDLSDGSIHEYPSFFGESEKGTQIRTD